MLRVITVAARLLTRVAAVFLLGMVAMTVIDVGFRSTVNAPIFGTYEIIEQLLAAVAFFAIGETFLRDQHITIELIDHVVPDVMVGWMRTFGTLAALVFVTLLAYHMLEPAMDFIEFDEVSIDLQLPVIWKASFVLAGIGFSIATVAVMFVRDLTSAFRAKE